MLACGLEPGRDVAIAIDIASSHFFDPSTNSYKLTATGNMVLDSNGMVELLADWMSRYPIVSIEDGLAEDDWDGWIALTKKLGSRVPAHR